MADVHMVREHALGLAAARKIAQGWAKQVEDRLDMTCTCESGHDEDRLHFKRAGVTGSLLVTKDRFELDAKLGLLVAAFKGRIEAGITRYLDELLTTGQDPLDKLAGKKGPTS